MSVIKDWDPVNPETGFTRENGQFCCPYSITTVKLPDGSTGNCSRFQLKKTDAVVSGSKRAELQLSPDVDTQKQKTYYGWRYWLEKLDSDNGAESLLQWHDSDGTTPPLSVQVGGGRFNICRSFTTGNIHHDAGQTTIAKWINFVIGVTWAEDTTGTLEVWRDGVKLVDLKGIRTNCSGGSYFKYGINKWSWGPASGGGGSSNVSTDRIFYIDRFKMGTTFADVDPMVGTVMPPVNQKPVVNAGVDQTVKSTTVQLAGAVSDPDGTIASVLWAGPGTISKPNVANTAVTGLPPGVYTFTLTATDNQGANSSDDVQITVLAPDPVPVIPRKVVSALLTYDDGGTQTL